MKKRFFKKLKKIILTLSCVLSCLVIFTVSVSAEVLSDVELFSVRMVNLSYGDDISTQDLSYNGSYPLWTSSSFNKYMFNFSGSVIRCDFTCYYDDLIKSGNYTVKIPFQFSVNQSTSNNLSGLGSVDVTVLFPNGNLSKSLSVVPVKSGASYVFDLSFDLNVSAVSNDLFNDFSLILHFNNATASTQAAIYWFGFTSVYPSIVFNPETPFYEQPNYSQPSSGSASDLEGVESELIGSTNSASQDEINKSFNISFDLIQQWAYPISAFRDAFNYFVHSHNAVYTICIITLVIGVFLLFSNFVPRGRDK